MSDHSHSPPATTEPLPFSKKELQQFDADDAQAGASIGKMLSLFFLYTVIVMSISGLTTYWWTHAANRLQ